MSQEEKTHLYPQLSRAVPLSSTATINEQSPLHVHTQQSKPAESEYSTVYLTRYARRYEFEESCLKYWLLGCLLLTASIIPIAEIIILFIYFRDIPRCPLQFEWCYFILCKLLVQLIAPPLFAALWRLRCALCRLHIFGGVCFVCLLAWNIGLTVELFSYRQDDTYDASKCDLLFDFVLFETVSVWAVVLLLLCIGCWLALYECIITTMSGCAYIMHNFVTNVDVTELYQWIMSVVEIVFLANYFDHYGDCSELYGQYVLAKFVFTVLVIAGNHFVHCGGCEKQRRRQWLLVVYVAGLTAWCIAISVLFWGSEHEQEHEAQVMKCRSDAFTSHYYDFVLVDIILGYAVVLKVFCTACWIQVATFLGSEHAVERYGEFARSNTAEWIRYRENKRRYT